MALAPNIPTSFVPKQPVKTAPRRPTGGVDTLLLISLVILVATIAASGAIFGYHLLLKSTIAAKASRLAAAQERIDETTVQDFIRTRNRFASADVLMGNHVAASQLFSALETRTLQNVRFSSLNLAIAEDRTATLSMAGTARTFNALAAQSSEFGKEAGLSRVIFSNIALEENETVTFTLSADVNSALIVMQEPDAPSAPVLPDETAPVVSPEEGTATSSAPTP